VGDLLDPSDDLTLAASEPFEETRFGLGLTYRRPRTSFSVSGSRTKSDFESRNDLDRTTNTYQVTFSRRLTPRADFTLRAGRDEDALDTGTYDVTDSSVGATLQWRLTRSIGFGVNVEQRERSGGASGDNFSELSGNVLLRYSPWTPDAGLESSAGSGGSFN
jgi:hypothetical protein